MTAALLSDAHFFGLWVLGCLIAWFAAVMFSLAIARAAAKPAPKLADRMTAARDWTPAAVDAASAEIVKEVGR